MRSSAWMCLLALVVVAQANMASPQGYPSKPVRLVTAAAGAGGDFVSRIVAIGPSELWEQSVIIDNRGGSAVIPIELVAKAPPDGYTLLGFGTALWHLPLMQSVAYDPIKDFAPITMVTNTPMILVVHPSVPVKSTEELIALARKRPAQLNYSSGISGSTTHLPAELFKFMAGIDIVRVSYKGGAPAQRVARRRNATDVRERRRRGTPCENRKDQGAGGYYRPAFDAFPGSADYRCIRACGIRSYIVTGHIRPRRHACVARQSAEPGCGETSGEAGFEGAVPSKRVGNRGQFA